MQCGWCYAVGWVEGGASVRTCIHACMQCGRCYAVEKTSSNDGWKAELVYAHASTRACSVGGVCGAGQGLISVCTCMYMCILHWPLFQESHFHQ